MPTDDHPERRARRPLAVVAGIVIAAGVIGVGAWALAGRSTPRPRPAASHPGGASSGPAGASASASPSKAGCATSVVPPATSIIATTRGAVPAYARPGGPALGAVPASWHGGVSALPVIGEQPGWLQVRLAPRPNGATAWLRSADVTLTSTPDRIVVDLGRRRLCLFTGGRLRLAAPAGIGTPDAPTVPGHFFVALFAAPASPGYGPFVLVTSAHSATISDWEQSGDALIAIHGPLGSDRAIGTSGAAVSHGCVRLHLADLAVLRTVPAGSPVDILPAPAPAGAPGPGAG